ncbi:MAG: HDOD domain-containing protein [Candidatus Zixiibacteriota bacterium]
MTNQSPHSTSAVSSKEQARSIVSSMGELPASPEVIKVVMDRTADFNSDIQGLSKALSADQTITAKVLKLSNSSFYGRAHSVATLDEAIMILGFFTLRSLVVATATHSMFDGSDAGGHQRTLWEHSLATAMACRLVGGRVEGLNNDEAFLAGLMHDLGKLILIQKMPEDYAKIIEKAKEECVPFTQLEDSAFGFNHTDLGQALMDEWAFPPELIESIRDHHLQDYSSAADEPVSLACVVNLADTISNYLQIGFACKDAPEPWTTNSAARIGLDSANLKEICEELQNSFAEEKRHFEG